MNMHRPRPFMLLLAASVLGGLTALIVASRTPVQQHVSISFAVNRINASPSQNYQYDGYYAIQAADLFSQTVVSWFSTPSIVQEVYNQAGVSTSNDQLSRLTGRFKTKKYAAQNIVVTFHEATVDSANKVAAAVSTIIHERASVLNQTSDRTALFEVLGSTPVVAQVVPNRLMNTVLGLVAGFLLALAALSIASYVQSLNQSLATANPTNHARRD